ncbi:hypothetical protein [Fibrobacter sp.]|uniref:hypothetical protein n=1 Tax=Fibrobacter sp. TaxID=35828 RepID=UPI0025BED440|nr:hypothetical protein [Fibrobacter sp.]MBR4007497.1 hypothetical protein [Fibrobacter sp.]
MKIGLVDVDGHAKKKKWGATIYPNIALCKISRYHKQQGDTVEWAFPFKHYDVVYMSKVFNFSPDDMICYNADRIVRGGTGYNIESQLPDEIDQLQPDYSIYPNIPSDTAYGFLTRGCPNRCPWCVVPRKEGRIRPYMDCDEIAIEGRTKLVLMDNNILAAGDYAVRQLEKIIEHGYRVDFNQALDARLVTDEYARLLARIKWIDRRIRFGCDTKRQIAECERAISMINGYGYRGEYFLYTMIGGKSDLMESFERVNYWWKRNHEQRERHEQNIYPYAQPYRNPDNPHDKIPEWQKDIARWVNKRQIFQITDFYNFEPRKGFKCAEYFTIIK